MTDSVIALDTTRAAIEEALDAARDQLAAFEHQKFARQDWIGITRRRVSILEAQLSAWDRAAV
jgi:hypothetical protein